MSDFVHNGWKRGNANTTLSDFLSEVSPLTDQDSDKDGDDEKITLMTVHSAKGWSLKCLCGGHGRKPVSERYGGRPPRALEEERRLFT